MALVVVGWWLRVYGLNGGVMTLVCGGVMTFWWLVGGGGGGGRSGVVVSGRVMTMGGGRSTGGGMTPVGEWRLVVGGQCTGV